MTDFDESKYPRDAKGHFTSVSQEDVQDLTVNSILAKGAPEHEGRRNNSEYSRYGWLYHPQ